MTSPPLPFRADIQNLWTLKPGVRFLNHGSFGAVPIAVKQAQDQWRNRIEAEPIEIIGRRSEEILNQVKIPVGHQFGMKPENFGFVTNATEGINAVLQSIKIEPGDELLTTDHVYHAVRQTMKLLARRHGATCREITIPLPVTSPDQIQNLVVNSITSRTRLLVIDQVTSPSALIFPVAQITAACREKGVDVLIDGAHVPGMLPLNVEQLGAAYYVANLHKWICAPRGSAFLWVAPDKQKGIHPTTISHFLNEGFAREFSWQGTQDFSAWFSIPAALKFLNELGFEKMMAHNHQLAVWSHQLLSQRWGVDPISPTDGSLIGSMATIKLPGSLSHADGPAFQAFQERLYHEFNIEAPLMRWNGQTFLRVSCQLYNQTSDYEFLADTIAKMV